ncbi:hypothetical protein AB0M46_49890, partial [Dactylosporangium sp. NPDC051485]
MRPFRPGADQPVAKLGATQAGRQGAPAEATPAKPTGPTGGKPPELRATTWTPATPPALATHHLPNPEDADWSDLDRLGAQDWDVPTPADWSPDDVWAAASQWGVRAASTPEQPATGSGWGPPPPSATPGNAPHATTPDWGPPPPSGTPGTTPHATTPVWGPPPPSATPGNAPHATTPNWGPPPPSGTPGTAAHRTTAGGATHAATSGWGPLPPVGSPMPRRRRSRRRRARRSARSWPRRP